jgi:predicted alpha/beta hydrolase family esterase
MIALLWMLNPLWEGVIAPLILFVVGYWSRPRIERWIERVEEADERRPYDWDKE